MSTQKTADEKRRRGWRLFGGGSTAAEETEEEEHGVTASKGRATPGRRSTTTSEGNIVTRTVGGVREYFEGVASELSKVTWPTREDTRRLSIIVIITTVLASIALGIITLAFSELFQIGLGQPLVFLGFFVVVVALGFVFYLRSNRVSP
jgi:preprotein translocase subunit SecE